MAKFLTCGEFVHGRGGGGILITELMRNVFKRKRENKKKNMFQLKEVH